MEGVEGGPSFSLVRGDESVGWMRRFLHHFEHFNKLVADRLLRCDVEGRPCLLQLLASFNILELDASAFIVSGEMQDLRSSSTSILHISPRPARENAPWEPEPSCASAPIL